MGRCGCASECLCSLAGSACISVTGSGSVATPYTVAPIVDPDPANTLECREDGLFAGAAASLVFGETDCITLSGTGTVLDPIVAAPVIDPDPTNVLSCGPDGLFVDGSLTGGVLVDLGSSPTVLPPALIGVPSRAQWLLDTDAGSNNIGTYPAGTGVLPQAYFECLPGYDGIYIASFIVSGWTAGPAAAGDVIFRVGIGASNAGGAAGLVGSPVYTSAAAPYNIPAVGGSVAIPLSAGDRAWVEVGVEDYSGAFAGATLSAGPTYDAQPTSGLAFTLYRIGPP